MSVVKDLIRRLEGGLIRGGPLVNCVVYLALCLFALGVQSLSGFQSAEWRLYDQGVRMLRMQTTPPVSNEVLVIGIDEETFRRFPEPFALWHGHLGRLVQALQVAKPSVAGLDIVLPAQSYDAVVPGIDKQLMLPLLKARGELPLVFAQTVDEHLQPRPIFPGFTALMGPEQLGSALLCWDDDSVIRHHWSSQCTREGPQDGLAVRMARVLNAPDRGYGLIDYRLGSAFNYIPMHEVLDWFDRGDEKTLRDKFGGKPVLVGLVLPLEDRLKVPAYLFAQEPENSRVPGVMVHAQLLRSLLNQGLIKDVPREVEVFLTLCACLCWFGHGFKKSVLYWALFLIIPAMSLYLLWLGYVLMPAGLILAAKTAYVSRQGVQGMRLSHQRKRLAQAFAGHVSPSALDRILRIESQSPGKELSSSMGLGAVLVCRLFPQNAREDLAGEELLKVMSVFYDAVKVSVAHVDGMVDRLQDLEVTGWIGVPLRILNPERAAMEAALHLQRSFPKWSALMEAQGLRVHLAVGVASGQLCCGQVQLKQGNPFVVLGHAIDKAHQLAAIVPGSAGVTVRVCSATAAAVQHRGLEPGFLGDLPYCELVLK